MGEFPYTAHFLTLFSYCLMRERILNILKLQKINFNKVVSIQKLNLINFLNDLNNYEEHNLKNGLNFKEYMLHEINLFKH